MSTDTEEEEEFPELKKISLADIQSSTSHNEKRWRLSLLKKQFIILQLDALYRRFIERISHGYFSQFLSLQIILITGHFILLFTYAKEKQKVVPDLVLYGIISLFSVFLLYITDTYVKSKPKLLNYLAAIAFIVIFIANFFIPFYYKTEKVNENLRPAYTTYLIISNYIFLNIHNDLIAIVLGLFVSIFHLSTLILVTYDEIDRLYQRIGSDSIFLLGINCLGIYFRYMNEIVIRRSFLDKRSCIWSTHQLAFEYQQAQQLLSSIIPEHIIVKVRGSLLDTIKKKQCQGNKTQLGHLCNCRKKPSGNKKYENEPNRFLIKPFDEVYVQNYPNVTILFADIVNYTAMTTQLNVIDLLEILNELFGRFDDASDRLQVLRIKFLGDCYYCVSGLPPNPPLNPAEACVDLGLKMIAIIADIRTRKERLDINMRIGIHSGNISCGIIGALKWQYDIWSADVDLANKMETEGTAGMVHITKETKGFLKKNYNIKPSSKTVNGSRTYLITPGPEKLVSFNEEEENTNEVAKVEDQRRPSLYIKRSSTVPNDLKNIKIGTNNQLVSENNEVKVTIENEKKGVVEGKRHTFPTSNERRRSSGIFQKRSLNSRVRYLSERRLTPHDVKRRTAFMNNNIKRHSERLEAINKELEEDIENMLISKFEQWFKANHMYRILLIFKDLKNETDFIKMPDPLFRYYLVTKILVLGLVFVLENLTLPRWELPLWPFYISFGVTLLFFIPLSWTYFIWTKFFAINENVSPENIVIRFLYTGSKLIIKSTFVRFLIYTFLYFLFCLCVLSEWIDCYPSAPVSEGVTTRKRNFITLLYERNMPSEHCIIPWHMTETFALAIIVSFLFLRMYMWLKLFYASALAITYGICITNFSGNYYDVSQAFNIGLRPEISHVMSIFFLTIILHLVDRQTEHMNRTDHLWYKKLAIQEKKATTLQTINKILLQNILPVHVASEYLDIDRKVSNDLYTENYSDVAVMFASIVNISVENLGPGFLKIMNTIISEFDMLLVHQHYGRPIEKIKIAKWTYMAACGVVPGKGDSDNYQKDHKENVVISLLKFATSLMKKMKKLNRETSQDMQLRIGIANGPVAAGVVGCKKPLYDIWGDPVNMASRMDTTGIERRIQVLESTAEIIQKFGYVCEYRGETVVKGRPHPVKTYFVSVDENFSLIEQNDDEK